MAIEPIRMTYNGVTFASTLEADWAATFDKYDWTWQYEPEGYKIGETYYRPDFHLKNLKVFGEVKGPLEERISKPHEFQRALHEFEGHKWEFERHLVVILRPPTAETLDWEGTLPGHHIMITLCGHCHHFAFMDYNDVWQCRMCNNYGKVWDLPGGDIFGPGELPFYRAPRPARRAA